MREYEKQWEDLPVHHLILASRDYIVFLDKERDIDWSTTDEFDARPKTEPEKKQLNFILNEAARVEGYPCTGLTDPVIISFKRQIGESIVRAFDGDFESARQMMKAAESFIISRNMEHSRYLYLCAAGWSATSCVLPGIIFWIFRDFWSGLFGQTTFYIVLSFLVGGVGALLSVILRMGKSNMDFNASKKLHYIEAGSRILAGMISGLLIALCIHAEIILPIFTKINSTHTAMVLGGLIAGCSERLAPSIIKKFDAHK